MNKKILIAYANEPMKYSAKFLKIQALYSRVFNKVILFSEKDMPAEIQSCQLFKYTRGGGYWVWKPYIIWKTLQNFDEGDIVCYIDSGCTMQKNEEWDKYFSFLEKTDVVCFQYQDYVAAWENAFGCGKTSIKYWTKKKTLDYFDSKIESTEYHNFNKIMGGLIFAKGKNNKFIKDWLDTTLTHPELVLDPKKDDEEYNFFSGYHRHDQSIITPLIWKYRASTTILPEQFDENRCSKIVAASRNRIYSRRQFYKSIYKFFIRIITCKTLLI